MSSWGPSFTKAWLSDQKSPAALRWNGLCFHWACAVLPTVLKPLLQPLLGSRALDQPEDAGRDWKRRGVCVRVRWKAHFWDTFGL